VFGLDGVNRLILSCKYGTAIGKLDVFDRTHHVSISVIQGTILHILVCGPKFWTIKVLDFGVLLAVIHENQYRCRVQSTCAVVVGEISNEGWMSMRGGLCRLGDVD